MTYDATERSVQSGAPVELYEFARTTVDLSTPCMPITTTTVLYRYTSADADVNFESNDWTATPIQRSAVEATREMNRNNLTLTVPRNFEIADLFRVSPPSDVILLTVYRYHRDDANKVVLWMGRVLNCEWGDGLARLTCEPVATSMRRPGLRRLYQKQCPHVLYACGVDRTAFDHATTVSAISGSTLTVASLGAHPYAGGFVEWTPSAGAVERRFIRSFSGTDLVLSRPFDGLAVSDDVTVYPGCDHTMATCDTVFNNLPNYGGFPFVPTKNPFGGNPVY